MFLCSNVQTVSLLVWGMEMVKTVLAELGITSELGPEVAFDAADNEKIKQFPASEKKDYFVERDGVKFAGMHLLIELWGACNLDDPEMIETTLREAAEVSGATILHAHMHRFSPFGGVSGVVVLAESHISIHTWPERSYAALDVFMCGECDPYKAIPVLRRTFEPENVQLAEHKRGMIP